MFFLLPCIIAFGIANNLPFGYAITELDTISLLEYDPYIIPRKRWGHLNQHSGYKSSEKLMKYKTVNTALGNMQVPVEDFSKLAELTKSEFFSVLNSVSRFESEEDSLLGLELIEEGSMEEGMELLQKSHESIISELGEDHVLFSSSLADIGYALFRAKEYERAYQYLYNATNLDENHIDQYGARNFGASANLLGIVAMRIGSSKFVQISNLLQNAFEKLVAAKDPQRFKVLLNLAIMYRDAWLPVRAIAILKLARHIVPKNSELFFDTHLYLATTYILRDDYITALKLLDVAMDGYMQLNLIKFHPRVLECQFQIANTLLLNNQYENAFQTFSRIKEVYSASMDVHSSSIALLISGMGQALLGMNQTDKAIVFFEAALAAITPTQRKSRVVELKIVHNLAKANEKLDKPEAAAKMHEQAVTLGTELFGSTHSFVVQHQNYIS